MDDFVEELERQVPSLRRYARALMRDGDAADDLVHDCIERALSRRHLWKPSGTLRSWLFTILHNLHANEMRRRARRPQLSGLHLVEGQLQQSPSQHDHLMAGDMEAALGMLSADQRQVVLLVALEGFSYAEVAEMLGVPLGTIMSRLSRARARLADLVDGTTGERLRSVRR